MTFFTPEMRRDPYPIYQRMRRDAPVLHYPPTDAWMLFGHDAVKRALTDHETFSSAVSGGTPARWLIFQDPPRHSKLRALVSAPNAGKAFDLGCKVREGLVSFLAREHPDALPKVRGVAA